MGGKKEVLGYTKKKKKVVKKAKPVEPVILEENEQQEG